MKTERKQIKPTFEHKEILIREPVLADAEILTQFSNEISRERTYVAMQGEESTKNDTKLYLKRVIENIKNKLEVHLLVFSNDELVAVGDVTTRKKIYAHTCTLSIVVKKEFRGQGLGIILTEKLLAEASRLKGLKKVILQVFANNTPAINLYKKFGFKEYGNLPGAIKWRGKYVDEILMYKDL